MECYVKTNTPSIHLLFGILYNEGGARIPSLPSYIINPNPSILLPWDQSLLSRAQNPTEYPSRVIGLRLLLA